MINPNGSNIPHAREILREVIDGTRGYVDDDAQEALEEALRHMTRQKPVRQARVQQRVKITDEMMDAIRALAPDTSLSNVDIATRVGLPPCASGRVTEVLQGLR